MNAMFPKAPTYTETYTRQPLNLDPTATIGWDKKVRVKVGNSGLRTTTSWTVFASICYLDFTPEEARERPIERDLRLQYSTTYGARLYHLFGFLNSSKDDQIPGTNCPIPKVMFIETNEEFFDANEALFRGTGYMQDEGYRKSITGQTLHRLSIEVEKARVDEKFMAKLAQYNDRCVVANYMVYPA